MEHGDFKHQLLIQRPPTAPSQDTTGQEVLTPYVNVAVVYGSVEQLAARERFVVAQTLATATHRIRTRYTRLLDAVDTTWRILFGDRVFEIISANNVRESNREFEFICQEGPF